MFKLVKFAIIFIVVIIAFFIYIIMGLGQGNSIVNNNDSFESNDHDNSQLTYEFCSYVEEIKAHVADYVSVEGRSDHLDFLRKFETPVERKNRVAHMMYDGIKNDSFYVESLFDHGYDEFIKNANHYNELYLTSFPVKDCVDNVENNGLQPLVDKFSQG